MKNREGQRTQVFEAVLTAVDEINEQQPEDGKLGNSPDTTLYGKSGVLESVGLVNLIVATEQQLEEKLNISVTLADERAMSQETNPFSTIGSLVDYIMFILEEDEND